MLKSSRSSSSGRNPASFIFSAAAWLCGGAISGSLIYAQPVRAEPKIAPTLLMAQQVVDGLPPPPPSVGQTITSQAQSQQYIVYINGDSQALLSQVQQIQPTASIQSYNGQQYIQAGLFSDITTAQQQVTALAASGITAQIAPIAASTVSQATTSYSTTPYDPNALGSTALPPPEVLPTTAVPSNSSQVEFGSAPSSANPPETQAGSRAYYVIIPGGGRDLDEISSQIERLTSGMGIDNQVETGTAKGSHVRVGPFDSRSAANRWSRYFRDFGMDARLSYGR